MHYVYLLLCSDNKTYIGCTNDLMERIHRHKNGEVDATRNRKPIKLINYFAYSNKNTAYDFKKYLKLGSGRAFLKKHRMVGED